MTTAPMRASPRDDTTSKLPQQATRSGGRNVSLVQDFEVAEREELRARELVAEKPKLRLAPPIPVAVPRTPFIVLVVLVVVAGLLGILVLNTKINQNAFELDALHDSQIELDLRQQALEQYIAERESPGSLAAAAAKLGLTDPGPPAFILLPDGKVIGVPRPASGTPSNASQ